MEHVPPKLCGLRAKWTLEGKWGINAGKAKTIDFDSSSLVLTWTREYM